MRGREERRPSIGELVSQRGVMRVSIGFFCFFKFSKWRRWEKMAAAVEENRRHFAEIIQNGVDGNFYINLSKYSKWRHLFPKWRRLF